MTHYPLYDCDVLRAWLRQAQWQRDFVEAFSAYCDK
jgi:hypothetical protein